MKCSYLEVKKERHIASIDLRCGLDEREAVCEVAGEFADVCREISFDPDVYVIVLKGLENQGAHPFSCEEFVQAVDEKYFNWPAESVGKLDRPVLAAMNGNMIGLGLEAALACDLRIAGNGSSFGFPHVQYGMMPCDGATQRLSRIVGKANAFEMMLTGDTIDAQEAFRVGLVNRVTTDADLDHAVEEIAGGMASKGPIALRYSKEAIHKGMDLTLEQGLRLEADLYLLLHTTKDRVEGIKCFQEKKSPSFISG